MDGLNTEQCVTRAEIGSAPVLDPVGESGTLY